MTLEATVVILDNSDWMRNGDYTPSRLEAQADAVNAVFQVKTRSHPENTVGIMTMAGKGPEVLTTLTGDIGKILNALHRTTASGKVDLLAGIGVAQLVLKHRRDRNQRQRVIAFVGSPVTDDEASLVRLAKKLKKNNVAVDIVSFGEDIQNRGKLESFVNNVNSGDNSHLVSIPPGPHLLSDLLHASPILSSGEGPSGGFGGSGGAGNDFEFGIDPSMDPELAMALRISLEEEQARQAAAAAAAAATAAGGDHSTTAADTTNIPAAEVAVVCAGPEVTMMDEELTEEEQIARAIEMSLQQPQAEASDPTADFVSNILSGLPNVDPNDPQVQEALSKAREEGNDGDKKEGEH
ncbi:hypothetical protein THASP1DRAFT_33979 [Thamnocephalis sphaerospora]|uniref:VWFA domain-containing protein n=1 Tax=Thamnocephalis sphaerospora TaxID=78915 RepID=A0A4P9XX03_9FUNG|nr:hypothetical protein THASP1DRAFT_33979 [Thamnocephalis sphaerospora]|eukprot:RKP10885.1 hypothetical protein THASP1DRAFT_33979 [Thamnocephalis sphaerospora]